MSVRLNKEGQVVITCREHYRPHEEHYQRIQSLIELVQQRDEATDKPCLKPVRRHAARRGAVAGTAK